MRRNWLKLLVIPLTALAVTGFAVTLRKTTRRNDVAPASQPRAANAKSTNISVAGMPADNHSVRLISPAETEFDSTLDSAYPGLRMDASFHPMRQKIVLIANRSGQAVYGLVLKWTLQHSAGTSSVTYDPYVEGAGTERLITQGVVLAPNEVRLFSPSLELKRGQSTNAIVAQLRARNAISSDQTVLDSALDGAIFGDGTFVGPNEAKLLDRFECDRNGQHDEGYSMTLLLRNQPSDDEISAKLNEHIQRGWTYRTRTDREALYYVARGNEGQLLLQLLKQSGRASFEKAVERLVKVPPTKLRKL